MARVKHEEHQNHEAWAIPYGDLVTLLLAFFVVMYSISSVNEGKYRVLSDALSQAFGGPPKSMKPVQMGSHRASGSNSDQRINILNQNSVEQTLAGDMHDARSAVVMAGKLKLPTALQQLSASGATGYNAQKAALQHMADEVQKAMGPLIDRKMIIVRKTDTRLEIEIRTDILFASGVAMVDARAQPILAKLAAIMQPFPNALRIEGHTDNVPIHTLMFASNWELSAARAASVVHLFMERGVDPKRMSVEGFGEYQPALDNSSVEGRNRNRRVVLVVLAAPGETVPVESDAEAETKPVSDATAAADGATTLASASSGATSPVSASKAMPSSLASSPSQSSSPSSSASSISPAAIAATPASSAATAVTAPTATSSSTAAPTAAPTSASTNASTGASTTADTTASTAVPTKASAASMRTVGSATASSPSNDAASHAAGVASAARASAQPVVAKTPP